jgi:hypothetical protein
MERLAYSVAELQEALGIGRRQAYRLAQEIGVRVGERRIIVPRTRVEELLGNGSEALDTSPRVEDVEAHKEATG